MEAYVAPGNRRERVRAGQGERAYYHLVLLARDLEGYRNLVKLSSIGYTEGFYMRPRIDREVLARHSEGLIVSSACMAGEVNRHLLADNWEGAREAAEWYAKTFKDRYYLEVQAHNTEGQEKLNQRGLQAGRRDGAPGRRHQRRPFPPEGGPRSPRRPSLHRPGEGPERSQPDALRRRPLLQVATGDQRVLPRRIRRFWRTR